MTKQQTRTNYNRKRLGIVRGLAAAARQVVRIEGGT